MSQPIQPLTGSSLFIVNSECENKKTLFSSQMRKLCSAICLIICGVLLILGSIISVFALPYLGVTGPALALFVIPLLVGLVLIALGSYDLNAGMKVKFKMVFEKKLPDEKQLSDSKEIKDNKIHPKIYSQAVKFDPSLANKTNSLSPLNLETSDPKNLSKRGWR